jgi:hypothetical protein
VAWPERNDVLRGGTLWQTGAKMLIEVWEKFRGYDKWVNATAMIERSDVEKTPYNNRDGSVSYFYGAGDTIAWVADGTKHYADFNVEEGSPLFQLVGGESVAIRYNPKNPDEFYYRDLLKSRVNRFCRGVFIALVFIAILIIVLLRGPGRR